MKVRITYTYELSENDYKVLKKSKRKGRIINIRDFVWCSFVEGGIDTTNQQIYSEELRMFSLEEVGRESEEDYLHQKLIKSKNNKE